MDSKYKEYTDEQLAQLAQTGDSIAEETLIRKYMDDVREKRHIYFIAGADSEDVIQEGMIGLFKAVQSFESGKGAEFRTYANVCINRQIISAIRSAARLKHEPLNTSISLNAAGGLDNIIDKFDYNPENMITTETIDELLQEEGRKIFSKFERQVLNEYMSGQKYSAIAEKLGKSTKSIDNAMQRIRKKTIAYFSS